MARAGDGRSGGGWRPAATFVLAHAVAVVGGSLALALTGTVVVVLDYYRLADAGPGDPLPPLPALAGAPFVLVVAIVAGAVFALPASAVGWLLARWAVRRGAGGWRLIALGGAAGLVVGMPLLVTVLSIGDPRFVADPLAGVLDAVPLFGPAATVAGAGVAWVTARCDRPR